MLDLLCNNSIANEITVSAIKNDHTIFEFSASLSLSFTNQPQEIRI